MQTKIKTSRRNQVNDIEAKTHKARLNAGKHFGIENWSRLKHAAFRLALLELAVPQEYWDKALIERLIKRFKIGSAFAFYSQNREFIG